VHGKTSKVNAPTFNGFVGIDLESMPIKEGPGGKTGVSENFRHLRRSQPGLHLQLKPCAHTSTRHCGTSEQKIEVTIFSKRSEPGEDPLILGCNRLKRGQSLLPAVDIRRGRRPGKNLLRGIKWRRQNMD